ncbi:hypothetical protein ACFU7T_32865 [Streptomyces sp. NPDC057555]|uniref:hypothetical protein n=1 Tax=Streptomyces sp. NPDC057555 TaxID=3346166 RepID=UPI003689CFA5
MATAALVLRGSCTGAPPDAKPAPQGKGGAPASVGPRAERTEGLAAYRAMWHDFAEASKTSDAASATLRDHATSGALALMKYGLRRAKQDNVISKGVPRVAPEIISATGQEIHLRDCVDSTKWLQYKLNGELKNDVPGGHSKADATVKRLGETWKVTQLYLHEAGSC